MDQLKTKVQEYREDMDDDLSRYIEESSQSEEL